MVNVLQLIDDIGGQVTGPGHQQVEDLKKLIVTHQRRLQKLQEQQAEMGLYTPAHIETEIEDTKAEIERLQAELDGLR